MALAFQRALIYGLGLMGSPSNDLFLIRHAHRDNSISERNNGLSAKGITQSKNLRAYFSDIALVGEPVRVLSSPKKRCVQTVEDLLGSQTPKIEILQALDEQGPRESLPAFKKRVRSFCKSFRKGNRSTTILCSHADWLPLALEELLGLKIELKKGAVVWLRRDGNAIQLVEVRQWV